MPDPISSPANPKVRYVRRLESRSFRARERCIVVEGVRLVTEALVTGAHLRFAFVTEGLVTVDGGPTLRDAMDRAGAVVHVVSDGVMAAASDTVTPQGVLAVVEAPEVAWPEAPTSLLVLDGLRDPGNVGTVLRTALAASIDGVLLAPGTVDVTNAKVVRSGAGAHFRLPVRHASWRHVAELVSLREMAVWVADARGETRHDRVDWTAPFALVVGGEAAGPSRSALSLGRTVRIAMPGHAESLNAAVAAAVLLFEGVRQRWSADA